MLFDHRYPKCLFAIAAVLLGVASCGGDQSKEKETFYTSDEYEKNRPEPEPPPDPCMAEDGEPRQCRSNEDCCDGFLCSLDPERSRIIRYCIEG